MSRILVLGGYGGFGARLTRRLAARGHHVVVAGRSLEKATAFCLGSAGTEPLAADRNGDIPRLLADARPDLLIDAAGPFHDSFYHVARACAEASVSYLDLADARRFVAGIGAVDPAARRGGVAIVAGASSVPALSGAVAQRLAAGMDRVRTVDLAISASNRATAGASVVAAVLSYVGRPIRLWRGGRWTHGWGWQDLRRETFAVKGGKPLRGRWLALADVPDHETMPPMLPGRPAVTFRAGTQVALQTLALWLISWPVRWSGLRRLASLTPSFVRLARMTGFIGDDRSAMSVRLLGQIGDLYVERRWTLIADAGSGAEIPTLAAAILADRILAGAVPTGACDAGALLELEDFEPSFAALPLRHEIREKRSAPPLYARLMGARFAELPQAVRNVHDLRGDGSATGEAHVVRGGSALARCVAFLMRFPPAGRHPLHVAFAERDGVERWTREFGAHRFTSCLSGRTGRLVERFGALRFHFDLHSSRQGLEMRMIRWTCLGVSLPITLMPRTHAREWQEDGRFMFDVGIALPLVGPLVSYRGWLRPDRY